MNFLKNSLCQECCSDQKAAWVPACPHSGHRHPAGRGTASIKGAGLGDASLAPGASASNFLLEQKLFQTTWRQRQMEDGDATSCRPNTAPPPGLPPSSSLGRPPGSVAPPRPRPPPPPPREPAPPRLQSPAPHGASTWALRCPGQGANGATTLGRGQGSCARGEPQHRRVAAATAA